MVKGSGNGGWVTEKYLVVRQIQSSRERVCNKQRRLEDSKPRKDQPIVSCWQEADTNVMTNNDPAETRLSIEGCVRVNLVRFEVAWRGFDPVKMVVGSGTHGSP